MTPLTTDQQIDAYRRMVTIRRFEDRLYHLFLQGLGLSTSTRARKRLLSEYAVLCAQMM